MQRSPGRLKALEGRYGPTRLTTSVTPVRAIARLGLVYDVMPSTSDGGGGLQKRKLVWLLWIEHSTSRCLKLCFFSLALSQLS